MKKLILVSALLIGGLLQGQALVSPKVIKFGKQFAIAFVVHGICRIGTYTMGFSGKRSWLPRLLVGAGLTLGVDKKLFKRYGDVLPHVTGFMLSSLILNKLVLPKNNQQSYTVKQDTNKKIEILGTKDKRVDSDSSRSSKKDEKFNTINLIDDDLRDSALTHYNISITNPYDSMVGLSTQDEEEINNLINKKNNY